MAAVPPRFGASVPLILSDSRTQSPWSLRSSSSVESPRGGLENGAGANDNDSQARARHRRVGRRQGLRSMTPSPRPGAVDVLDGRLVSPHDAVARQTEHRGDAVAVLRAG